MKKSNLIIWGAIAVVFIFFTAFQLRVHGYVRKGAPKEDLGDRRSEARTLMDFKTLSVGKGLHVYFQQDSLGSLRLEAPEKLLPEIQVVQGPYTLNITGTQRIRKVDSIKIFLSNPFLDTLKVGTQSHFETNGVVWGKEVVLEFEGNSTGVLQLSYTRVKCIGSSDSKVKITGDSKEIDFSN
ncbi:DUF2807 domain-containing protein [Flavobacteriaceae bacterium 3-367]